MPAKKPTLRRYDYNNVGPHSSLGNKARPKRAGRLSNLMARHPARLPNPKPTIINRPDSRYERGTTGGRSAGRMVSLQSTAEHDPLAPRYDPSVQMMDLSRFGAASNKICGVCTTESTTPENFTAAMRRRHGEAAVYYAFGSFAYKAITLV